MRDHERWQLCGTFAIAHGLHLSFHCVLMLTSARSHHVPGQLRARASTPATSPFSCGKLQRQQCARLPARVVGSCLCVCPLPSVVCALCIHSCFILAASTMRSETVCLWHVPNPIINHPTPARTTRLSTDTCAKRWVAQCRACGRPLYHATVICRRSSRCSCCRALISSSAGIGLVLACRVVQWLC